MQTSLIHTFSSGINAIPQQGGALWEGRKVDYEWHLNLGLLANTYFSTENSDLKKQVSFLALQYLGRASHINSDNQPDGPSLGFFQDHATYHRSSRVFEEYLQEALERRYGRGNLFFLTDGTDFLHLLPVNYTPLSAEAIKEVIGNNLDFYRQLERPFIFDCTGEEDVNAIEKRIDAIILKGLENCENRSTLIAYVRANVVCISRSANTVVKVLPVFSKASDFAALENEREIFGSSIEDVLLGRFYSFEHFLNCTGTRLGAVRGRGKIFEFLSLEDFLQAAQKKGQPHTFTYYAPTGPNALYYPNKLDLINTRLFGALKEEDSLLVDATLRLVEGVLNEINDALWKELSDDLERRPLVQTSLVRIFNHLANVRFFKEDYNRQVESLELVHAEIATLLALFSPFAEGAYEEIIASRLSHIPKEYLQTGVAKSAMNLAATLFVRSKSPVMTDGLYHEQLSLVKRTFSEAINDPEVKEVDLYFAHFNPNINKDLKHTHYASPALIEEIDQLLEKKPSANGLTVAIDITIDFAVSQKAVQLYTHYAKAIEQGKLQLVFYRSGQKFDMFGMDGYYGAPWYRIGALKFGKIEECATDPLSMQWFCLANKYIFAQMEAYRKRAFDNTRYILDRVPEELKSGNALTVSTVASDVDPCFIEIKIHGNISLFRKVTTLFTKTLESAGVHYYGKPGFGFIFTNILPYATKSGEPRLIRITPGINPKDNEVILGVLNSVLQLRVLD